MIKFLIIAFICLYSNISYSAPASDFKMGKWYKIKQEIMWDCFYIMKTQSGWLCYLASIKRAGLTFIPDLEHKMEWDIK